MCLYVDMSATATTRGVTVGGAGIGDVGDLCDLS